MLPQKNEQKQTLILHDYHFGGYAKYDLKLIGFMNEMWLQHGLPLDFVYTAKAFYGLRDVIANGNLIPPNSRILFIHTGGLQGNLSLPKEALTF